MSDKVNFTACRSCSKEWESIEEFITDEAVQLEGFLPDFGHPEQSVYLLRHVTDQCKAPMQVQAGRLKEVYSGRYHQQLLLMTDACEGKCLDYRNLEPCVAPCMMTWTRDVMQCLRDHSLPNASSEESMLGKGHR